MHKTQNQQGMACAVGSAGGEGRKGPAGITKVNSSGWEWQRQWVVLVGSKIMLVARSGACTCRNGQVLQLQPSPV